MRILLSVLIPVLLLAPPSAREARAQASPTPGAVAPDMPAAPKADELPAAATLDQLFDRLQRARTPGLARRYAREIEAHWLASGSETVDLLMSRATEALTHGEAPLARDLIDAAIALKPDYAEARNRRAVLNYVARDFDKAMADLDATLRLEPRHWGALVGLAAILDEYNLKPRALQALRQARAIYPLLPDLDARIDALALQVEGRGT